MGLKPGVWISMYCNIEEREECLSTPPAALTPFECKGAYSRSGIGYKKDRKMRR